MSFQLMDIPRWFLINMFLRFGFSRCLQELVHWCGFHAARNESEWCIDYYCDVLLLKQLLPDICQAAGDFYFPVHYACTRAPSCCDTRLRTTHQTCGFPIDQTSILYRLRDMDSHSGMRLSETARVVIQ